MATEKTLQQYIMKESRKHGIIVYKFSSPSHAGVPDLILILPGGDTIYIEVKHPNGKGRLSTLQSIQIAKIRKQGSRVYVVNTKEQADEIINEELYATATGSDRLYIRP